MNFCYFSVLLLLLFITSTVNSVTTEIKCAVCRSLIVEFRDAYLKEFKKRKVLQKNEKNLHFQSHMIELYESICKSFDDYAQARRKADGKLEALKMIMDGHMNPKMQDYNLIQDPDLNKGLSHNCFSILEDYEEQIEKFILENLETEEDVAKDLFCVDMTAICRADGKYDVVEDLPFVNLDQDFRAPPPGVEPMSPDGEEGEIEEEGEGKEEL